MPTILLDNGGSPPLRYDARAKCGYDESTSFIGVPKPSAAMTTTSCAAAKTMTDDNEWAAVGDEKTSMTIKLHHYRPIESQVTASDKHRYQPIEAEE